MKDPDPNTVVFSMKPVTTATPSFDARLSYDAPTRGYLLTIKNQSATVLGKLKLTHSEATGFSGEGDLVDAAGKPHRVTVTIAPKGEGSEWTFLDPAEPAKNNIVFSFTLFKRLP